MNQLHKHKIMSVGYQVKQNLKSRDMENLNSLLKFWVWKSGPKIDPATGVRIDRYTHRKIHMYFLTSVLYEITCIPSNTDKPDTDSNVGLCVLILDD